jgi:hypothetical protein
LVAGVAILIGSGAAISAEKPSPQSADQNAPQTKSGQDSQQSVVMPDAEKIVLLLRNTLITLNDAVQTGNFTVLRDRGAPGFREANSAVRLGQIFSDLASKGIDLSAVSVIAPQLTETPTLDQKKGMLHLRGYFPGQPVQINFEMLFQAVSGHWRLFGLSVQPAPSTGPPRSVSGDASDFSGKR